MRAIILSAGRSTRFAKEGCVIPKHLLRMPDGRTLIEWQEEKMSKISANVYTVVLKENVKETSKYLRGNLVSVKKSASPLDTLFRSWRLLRTKEPIIVIYNDALISDKEYYRFVLESAPLDATQIVFASHADRFQYIMNGWADGGVYYFKSGYYALSLLARILPPYSAKKGLMLLVKKANYISYIVSHSHVDLGIPRDYKNWMGEQGCPITEW